MCSKVGCTVIVTKISDFETGGGGVKVTGAGLCMKERERERVSVRDESERRMSAWY